MIKDYKKDESIMNIYFNNAPQYKDFNRLIEIAILLRKGGRKLYELDVSQELKQRGVNISIEDIKNTKIILSRQSSMTDDQKKPALPYWLTKPNED